MRTWPARCVRIEGRAFNVYDKDEWEKYVAGGGEKGGAPPPAPRGSSIVDCSVLEKVDATQKPELIAKVPKAKLILGGDGLLGGGTATYCFDKEGTRDRFALALENMAEGREWHEDAMSESRARLTSTEGLIGGDSAGGGGGSPGRGIVSGGAPTDMSHTCALPMCQVMKDYLGLMDVYKAFVAGATARDQTINRLKSSNPSKYTTNHHQHLSSGDVPDRYGLC